ncbi:hypothetical protein ASF12_02015 [Paenibacillus sp. Leaf72]|nr:hypothetical protein ASF12_02015 [Paenibacillus sp. Leaf72]
MIDFDFQLDNFMLYCSSKNLSRKTLASYEQTLKLFGKYLLEEFQMKMLKKFSRVMFDNTSSMFFRGASAHS